MDTARPGLAQIAKAAVIRSVKEFDVLFAILFTASYMSPTLSALFMVNTVKPTVILFGLWLLSFCINTFIVKKREGGVVQFIKDVFRSPRIWELFLFAAWMVLLAGNALRGRGINGHIAFSYYSIFLAMMVLDYCYSVTGEQWKTKYMIYVLLFITSVEYIRGAFAFMPVKDGAYISRQLSTGIYTAEQRRAFQLQGIGGYEVNTGMGILTGVFLLYIIKAKYRWPLIIMFLVCMVGMFLSGYTFPVMFACATMIIACIYCWTKASKEGRDRKLIPRLTAAVAAIFALMLILAYPLNISPAQVYAQKISYAYRHDIKPKLYAMVGKEMSEEQLQELQEEARVDIVLEQVIQQQLEDVDPAGMGSIATRMLLYKESWKTFAKNWAFGVGPVVNAKVPGVGGHSTWADYFATFGAMQFIFFIGYMLCMGARIIRDTRGMERFYRMLGFCTFVAYAFINPVISHKVFPIVLCIMIGGDMPVDGIGYMGDLKPRKARKRAIEMPAPTTTTTSK